MVRYRFSAIVILLMLVIASTVSAQLTQAQRPDWVPGLYWRYFNEVQGESLEYWVLGVRAIRDVDHYVLAQRLASDDVSVSLAFAPVRSPFPRRTNTPASQTYLDFPLEVGVTWAVREAASAGFLTAQAIDAHLETVEQIETGFGTYDAFRIAYARSDAVWHLWYSPAIKSWIKQTSPNNGSAFVLQESWQFTLAHALNEFFISIEATLMDDRIDSRRLLNELIRFGFEAERAEALKMQL